jgi:predicted O-methyltransferase YrrM
MDQAVVEMLAEYEKRAAAERPLIEKLPPHEGPFRDPFLLSVGPATGRLLNLLVRQLKPKTVLEIGTSYGYSTIWLAEAADAIGAKVITLELSPMKSQHASEALAKIGLAKVVEFRMGDALELIAALPGPFDFILLDLWKDLYVPCFDLFYPKLSPGALVVADNMIHPPFDREPAARYRRHARSKPHMESLLLPIGSGLELSRFAPNES